MFLEAVNILLIGLCLLVESVLAVKTTNKKGCAYTNLYFNNSGAGRRQKFN